MHILSLILSLSVTTFVSGFAPIFGRNAVRGQVLLNAELKSQLSADMKAAMKAKEKVKLGSIRAIQTAWKQKEVDERVEVNDAMAIEIMAKLVKQRKESVASYEEAGRCVSMKIGYALLQLFNGHTLTYIY